MELNKWSPDNYYEQLKEPPIILKNICQLDLIEKLEGYLGRFQFNGRISIKRLIAYSEEKDYLKEYVEVISEVNLSNVYSTNKVKPFFRQCLLFMAMESMEIKQ